MHSDADFLVDVWETESDGKDSLKAVGLSPTRPPGIHTSLLSDKKNERGFTNAEGQHLFFACDVSDEGYWRILRSPAISALA